MNDARFDALAAMLAAARTRRAMLAALAAATVSGVAAPRHQEARAALVCRRRNERCNGKRECCSARCRQKKGKTRKCACSPEGKRCHEPSDCCSTGIQLFCVANYCVRER